VPRARVRVRTKKNPAVTGEPRRSLADASPGELESAALAVEGVAEAAAVPVHDGLRGRVVEIYVVLKRGSGGRAIEHEIEREICRVTTPKSVWIVPELPKSRSGKIVRSVLAGVSNFTDVGDATSLANPEIVEDIRRQVQAAKLERGETPMELTPEQIEEIRAFGQSE
jgi:acetyl-CoA synthetase